MSSKPIGIFDSGVGGLTVAAAVRRLLPNESLIYFGDTARVPYGIRSADTILRYTQECCTFLAKREVKAIVIACNTASAHALPYLSHQFHFPLLGVIEPGIDAAFDASKSKHIGVIGTAATIQSDVYAKRIKCQAPTAVVTSIACPLFVPLVEEDWLDNEITEAVAEKYLKSMTQDGIDTLILGCTHYPLLKATIKKVLGEKVSLIDSADVVARALAALLKEKNLLHNEIQKPSLQLYVTDLPTRFETHALRFLGEQIPSITRVTL